MKAPIRNRAIISFYNYHFTHTVPVIYTQNGNSDIPAFTELSGWFKPHADDDIDESFYFIPNI